MKTITLFFTLLIMLAAFLPSALAESYPATPPVTISLWSASGEKAVSNPDDPESIRLQVLEDDEWVDVECTGRYSKVTLFADYTITVGDTLVYRLLSPDEGTDYTTTIALDEVNDGFLGLWYYVYSAIGEEARYTFLDDNTFWLLTTLSGTQIQWRVTVRDDGHTPTSKRKIAELVNECNAACSTDLEKVIWMHDWLINNARYDEDYLQYSSWGVLMEGCGVCDSYSKAYSRLLNALGIPVKRVCVTAMRHAWNAVQLDGEWYMVDCTWDDPLISGSTAVLSGYEQHRDCLVPDSILKLSHAGYTPGENGPLCDSLTMNYYLTGHADRWGSLAEWLAPSAEVLNTRLLSGERRFNVSASELCSGVSSAWQAALICPTLENDVYSLGGITFPMTFAYRSGAFSCAVDMSEATVTLPAGLTAVSRGLLRHTGEVLCAVIPSGVKSIGAEAFSGCSSLLQVTIPASVTEIADDALTGAPYAAILTTHGSTAESWGKQKGLPVIYQ